MGKLVALLAFSVLMSCSSTRFVDSWRNKEIQSFDPKKLLVIGMTNNLTGRRIFEEELRLAFNQRGINAYESMGIIKEGFTDEERSMEEIDEMAQRLLDEGFDSVVITAVKGIDDKVNYRSDYYDMRFRWYRFGRYWFTYQDVFYSPGYYSNYKVYHVETAVYNLKADEERSLVWVGSFDIVDPNNIAATVDDYVAKIMKQMALEGLVAPLSK